MAQVVWNTDIDVYNPHVIPVTVAEGIAKYLSISDLLIFRTISKNTYLAVSDNKLWYSMIIELGLWSKSPSQESDLSTATQTTPLNCLDTFILNINDSEQKVLEIYRHLDVYYTDLLSNKPYDRLKIFQEFQHPEDQCKILNNLMRYSKINKNLSSRILIEEKLTSIFEIFENALLRELEVHFDLEDYTTMRRFVEILLKLDNQQTLIDFFIQKSILDNHNSTFEPLELLDIHEFFIEVLTEQDISTNAISVSALENFMNDLVTMFNTESNIIDMIFPQSIPMMYKISEELILNKIANKFDSIIGLAKVKNLYLEIVPCLYKMLTANFIKKLGISKNLVGEYHIVIQELIDLQFEQVVTDYLREELIVFKGTSNQQIAVWTNSIEQREEEITQNILKRARADTKKDFLSSFKKAFAVSSIDSEDMNAEREKSYSEIQAKEKILTENMKSISNTFSLKVSTKIINDGRLALGRMLNFENFTIVSVKSNVISSVQEIFISVLELIGTSHLKPGFDKALTYLSTYDPANNYGEGVKPIKPLVLFSDLVNIADLIIQMVEIFYKEEIINRGIIKNENSILNPSLQKKKKFEEMVDNYVADGLNVGLDVLINEIEKNYSSVLENMCYCPISESNQPIEGPTKAAERVIQILDGNFDLLVGCADNSLVEIFQQELAERVFQVVVKTIKKATISNTGAITLISDINLYYDFILMHIKTNKRVILPLFQSLKMVGNIFLISGGDSKAIGKLVSDLSKFNGIFNQEEIYEFVQRREDWNQIKKDVEKIMYGLSLGDCLIV